MSNGSHYEEWFKTIYMRSVTRHQHTHDQSRDHIATHPYKYTAYLTPSATPHSARVHRISRIQILGYHPPPGHHCTPLLAGHSQSLSYGSISSLHPPSHTFNTSSFFFTFNFFFTGRHFLHNHTSDKGDIRPPLNPQYPRLGLYWLFFVSHFTCA